MDHRKTTKADFIQTVAVVFISLLLIFGLAYAVGENSVRIGGLNAVWLCAVLSIGVQWLAWIPASIRRTESFYDLTGGLTYLLVVAFSLWAGNTASSPGVRGWLLSLMVCVWACRLSSFLFLRIHRAGKDRRFDILKQNPVRFMVPWTLQGLWVFLTVLVLLTVNCQENIGPAFGISDGLGIAMWVFGFSIEVIADRQKTAFNSKPENKGKWIDEGLWSKSRHPNCFGEIVLWSGVAVLGLNALSGWKYFALISPIFVFLLLTRVSGVPLLDAGAKKKWGSSPAYQAYRKKTRMLIPF